MSDAFNSVEGKVDSITFSNRASGFFILKVKQSDASIVAVKGNFPGVSIVIGTKAKFTGEWIDHATYGKQFLAAVCDVVAEKGRNGIITYLSANVPSIGPATAAKLYDAFGDDLPNVLENENEHDKIRALSFLNRNQAEALIKEWEIASESRTVAIFLADLGLSSNQIRSVFTKFGSGTREIVTKNPYRLYECPLVGFQTADVAARKLGIGADDMRRVHALFLFAMTELSASEGHMYCTSKQLQDYSRKLFKRHSIEPFSHGEYIADSAFFQALHDLQLSEDIVSINDRIYLDHHWDHESTAAECMAELLEQDPHPFGDLKQVLADFESERDLTLSDEQRQAFLMLEKSRVCVISGFPGTGKTLLISAFVHLFEKAHLDCALLSPTGIAAKRLSQVTGRPAATIHRALNYQKDGTWDFNASNKYHVDAVIVDEVSMCDGATFFHLISALPPTTIFILVGDSAQLPSVGAGYVLNNLMQCPSVPHVALSKIYRQAKQSDIISVAHSILRGEQVDTSLNMKSEFVFLNINKDQVVAEICKMATIMKNRAINFQTISPMYNGELGVNNLNAKLREVLNSEYISGNAAKLKHGDVDFYEGDRVMITKNDYDRMIFNGDVGKIIRISTKNNEVEVKIFDWFDQDSAIPRYMDKVFTFKIDEARQVLKVAYATTAHKCVSPDTLIETPDGLIRISNAPDIGEVSAPSGIVSYKNKVVNQHSNMLRITTSDGYTLECTEDHGLDVWDDELGYVRREASSLQKGNILPLKLGAEWINQKHKLLSVIDRGHYNEIHHRTPLALDEDVAEFFGLMVGDGTIFHGGFRLVKSVSAVIDRFTSLCHALFGVDAKRIDHNGTDGAEISSTFLSRWLDSFGFMTPRGKYIPDLILSSSLSVQAAFLRGLFEDGTVNINNRSSNVDHIELLTKFPSICRDLKVMLLRFDIISGYKERRAILSDGSESIYHVIYIYGKNVRRFADLIGFISPEKIRRSLLSYGVDRNYQIPILKKEALSIRDANGGPKFFNNSDKNVLVRHRMSRHQLTSMLSRARIKNDEWHTLSDRLKWHHSPIRKIERFVGSSVCVEVPHSHQFIQNGFSGWNCQGNEFDYVLMPMTMQYGIMLYRNLIYTAITRAKKKVFVFGDPMAFSYAISNDKETVRNSHLNSLIHAAVNQSDQENHPALIVPEPNGELSFEVRDSEIGS